MSTGSPASNSIDCGRRCGGHRPALRAAPSRAVSWALAAAIVVNPIANPLARPAAAAGKELISRSDYERCQAQDETQFRAAIETITVDALRKGTAAIDYKALVADEWRKGGLDDLIDQRVDIAVAEVKAETSWASLLQSLADSEQAQKLAVAVAERVYRSDAMKTGIDTLATGVGNELARPLELAVVDSAGPSLMCLQAFLGSRFGSTVSRAVVADAGNAFGLDPGKGGVEVSSGAVLRQSSGGITGAALIVIRRQLAGLAQRIGQRIVGSVLSRLVSVAAGGIGLVLIAKEVWELRHGVMPIIAGEMKSSDNKAKVQEELAKTIAEQIGEHVREIGAKTADQVLEIWGQFRRAHAKVLDLAERNPPFRRFVESVKADGLGRLDEVVGLLLPAEGEAGVLKRLDDGTLNEAVNIMPAAAMEIARDTRSVDAALKWNSLAGKDVAAVVEHGLHKRADPSGFTTGTLARLLALGDRQVIGRLAGQTAATRDTLFALDAAELKTLAKGLSETELGTLASYLTGLKPAPRERCTMSIRSANCSARWP